MLSHDFLAIHNVQATLQLLQANTLEIVDCGVG